MPTFQKSIWSEVFDALLAKHPEICDINGHVDEDVSFGIEIVARAIKDIRARKAASR